MWIFKLLQSRSRLFYVFLFVLSLLTSLCNAGILVVINMSLNESLKSNHVDLRMGGLFAGLILLSFVASACFQKYMVALTNEIMCSIELSVIEKVRHATFESFEKLGYEKVYAAISDARALSRMPTVFINLFNAFITIICALGYLYYTSFVSGIILTGIMFLLLGIYLYRDKHIAADLEKVRDLQDVYYDQLRELLNGFKQIAISFRRNNILFHKYILTNREESRKLNTRASGKYAINELSGMYSWYIILGIIIFVLPLMLKTSAVQTAAFVTTVLFTMSPLSQIIIFFPSYSFFRIAVGRITRLEAQLDLLPEESKGPVKGITEIQEIRFENLLYRFNKDDEASFAVHIPRLSIARGEIVFLTGGNGSGKTTFINLLTGLYTPTGGHIIINGEVAGREQLRALSNSMAVVYTNQHLFKANYDEHDLSAGNEQFNKYKRLLNLEGILQTDSVHNRIGNQLSKGQQKRALLLLALLEDHPVMVLDEWAAEQDPLNKDSFYCSWLELIRRSGKTIIAVTHDEEYFHCADRVIRFNGGTIVSDMLNNEMSNQLMSNEKN